MTVLHWRKRHAFALDASGLGVDVLLSSEDGGETWTCEVKTSHPSFYSAMAQAHRATAGNEAAGSESQPATGLGGLETRRDRKVAESAAEVQT